RCCRVACPPAPLLRSGDWHHVVRLGVQVGATPGFTEYWKIADAASIPLVRRTPIATITTKEGVEIYYKDWGPPRVPEGVTTRRPRWRPGRPARDGQSEVTRRPEFRFRPPTFTRRTACPSSPAVPSVARRGF